MTANPQATDYISKFLKEKNIESKSTLKGEYVTASATVKQWEEFFKTELFAYHHHSKNSMKTIQRASAYTLPSEISQYVEAVFNLVNIPVEHRPVPFKTLRDDPVASTDVIVPKKINDYYNVTSNKGNNYVSQAVFESLDQNYSPSDLKLFQQQYNLPQGNSTRYHIKIINS